MRFWQRGSLKWSLVCAEGEGGGGNGDGGGGGEKPWYSETLPETMHGWDEVKNAKTAEDFYTWVGEARSHIGQSIRIPGEDAGTEQWAAFNDKLVKKVPHLIPKPDMENAEAMTAHYRALGMPEKPEEYTMPEVENADMASAEPFRGIAHKHGLTQAQFKGVVADFTNAQIASAQAAIDANQEGHKALQTEWGADYNRRMSLATAVAKLTDAPPAVQDALKNGHGTPEEYKWFYGLATRFKGEGANILQDMNTGPQKSTPQQAQEQLDEIFGNKEHAYWNKMDPNHAAAVKKVRELMLLKDPENATKPAPGTAFTPGG